MKNKGKMVQAKDAEVGMVSDKAKVRLRHQLALNVLAYRDMHSVLVHSVLRVKDKQPELRAGGYLSGPGSFVVTAMGHRKS